MDVVWKLRDAKRAHIGWVSNARAIIEGMPLQKEQVPINETECTFGKWYFGDGQMLSHLREYQAISESHEKLHGQYLEIFTLLFQNNHKEKTTLFQKLFGSTSDAGDEHRNQAREKFHFLKETSMEISKKLDALEGVILAMDDATFQALR